MESARCVTWGSGAWWSVVSSVQSSSLQVSLTKSCPYTVMNSTSLCPQWMTSAVYHWSCWAVTLKQPWTSKPSAEWSSCLSSGTQLCTGMLQGWTGEEQQAPTDFGATCDLCYEFVFMRYMRTMSSSQKGATLYLNHSNSSYEMTPTNQTVSVFTSQPHLTLSSTQTQRT